MPNFGFNQSRIISRGQVASTFAGKIAVPESIIGTNKIIIFLDFNFRPTTISTTQNYE